MIASLIQLLEYPIPLRPSQKIPMALSREPREVSKRSENNSENVLRTSSSSKQDTKKLPTIDVHQNKNTTDNHMVIPDDFNENDEEKCCEDDDNVYEKGFPTSTSYKHRLNAVLQNEGDGIKNLMRSSNLNLDDDHIDN